MRNAIFESTVIGLIFLALPSASLSAHGAVADRIFEENRGEVRIGKNPVTSTPCAIHVSPELALRVSFDESEVEFVYPGESVECFKKKFASRTLVRVNKADPIACVLGARCDSFTLEVHYNASRQITRVRSLVNREVVDLCELVDEVVLERP